MPAQIDPLFLTAWVRAELDTLGEPQLAADFAALAARGVQDGLDEDEAELDAAGRIAERRGLLEGLERAAGELWLVEVREARGQGERLQRGRDASGRSVVATLRASAGAADRLSRLARALEADSEATVAELTSSLGGTPGCSVR